MKNPDLPLTIVSIRAEPNAAVHEIIVWVRTTFRRSRLLL